MLREEIRPYEYMIYPTLQTTWIRGKGLLIFFGLFLVEFGAGIFMAGSVLHSQWGQLAGWLISGVLGGACHFLFLGHPFRIYKAVRRPGKSWISRGLIIISLFQLLGFIYLILSYFSMHSLWITVMANIMAIATILYGGYEIADVKSIKTWNSSFLPIQMLIRSFFIGLAVVLAINLLIGLDHPNINMMKWLQMTLLINICLLFISIVSTGFEEGKERLFISMMLKGSLKWIFWPLIVIGGMVVPFITTIYSFGADLWGKETQILMIMVVLQVFADSLLRYCLIRSGYYQSIFPVKPLDFR
jgi:formate-dependent nitrite reductase membrane component NrfD